MHDLNQFFYKFSQLTKQDKDNIQHVAIQALEVQKMLEQKKYEQLDLEDEAKKINEALQVLIEANRFNDEAEVDECKARMISKYNKLANDIYKLSRENISVKNFYEIIDKYKHLDKVYILKAFKSELSLKVIPTEVAIIIKSIVSTTYKNNKETPITKETKALIKKIFDVKVEDRELSQYKESHQLFSLLSHLI